MTAQKLVYMPMVLILNKKRYVSSSSLFDLKKNQSKKFWTALCMYIYSAASSKGNSPQSTI